MHEDHDTAWAGDCDASDPGGPSQLLGAIANLIVPCIGREGISVVAIVLLDISRVGRPLTIITLRIGRCGFGCDSPKAGASTILSRLTPSFLLADVRAPSALSSRVPVTEHHWTTEWHW